MLGPVFRRRRFNDGYESALGSLDVLELQRKIALQIRRRETSGDSPLNRADRLQVTTMIWRDLGLLDNDMVHRESIDLLERMGVGQITAPKSLRHTFATIL